MIKILSLLILSHFFFPWAQANWNQERQGKWERCSYEANLSKEQIDLISILHKSFDQNTEHLTKQQKEKEEKKLYEYILRAITIFPTQRHALAQCLYQKNDNIFFSFQSNN